MKIFVSEDTFMNEFKEYKEPMKQLKICDTDKSLQLGQIIVEDNNSKRFLIDIRDPDNLKSEELKK